MFFNLHERNHSKTSVMKQARILLSTLLCIAAMAVANSSLATPPACSADVEITNGVYSSNDTIIVCMNVPLHFEDQSLLEGAITQRDWDFGDGNGAVDGLLSTVTDYAYTTEGTYTMSLTVDALLCSPMTITRTIIVLGQPQFSTASSDVDCSGNCNGSASVEIIGANAPFYRFTWDDPLLQENDTAFNLCAGTYHAIIADDYSCTDMMTSPVNIFQPQPLTASIDAGDTLNLCPANGTTGITITLGGGAGNNQAMWTTSSNISAPSADLMNFTPTELGLNQMYHVTIMDNNGCSVSDSIYIRATPSSLQGTVAMESDPCVACEVLRYHFDAQAGVWHVIESVITDALGQYDFGQVENFEDFVLMADPEDLAHPMGVETYYPQAYHWADATVFNMCGDDFVKHIPLIAPMNFNGDNTISGTVWYSANGKTQTEEDPIPLIDVVVEKTPPGQAQGRVATNGSGEYEFQFVPSSDTLYTLFVNVPGVPVSDTYEILANVGGQNFYNLDFCLNIDSTDISPCQVGQPVVTGEVESAETNFNLYPNPNNGMFTIETGTFAESASEVRIMDQMGRLVFRKQYAETPYTINMVNIAEGYYVVQILNDADADAAPISVIRN